MTILILVLCVLAYHRTCSVGIDRISGRVRLAVVRLAFVTVWLLGLFWVVKGAPDARQCRCWLQQNMATVESAVARRFFFSSSPHPGVVKQTMGSSRVLETKQ